MRHGRKSAKRRIDGYKRHILRDLDERLIIAAALRPANEPEHEALEPVLLASELQERQLTELHGGSLAVQSAKGAGTTVEVRLPKVVVV